MIAWQACGSRRRFLVAWLDSAPWRRPARPEDRCFMGAPVSPDVHCRREAMPDALWCRRHQPSSGEGTPRSDVQEKA